MIDRCPLCGGEFLLEKYSLTCKINNEYYGNSHFFWSFDSFLYVPSFCIKFNRFSCVFSHLNNLVIIYRQNSDYNNDLFLLNEERAFSSIDEFVACSKELVPKLEQNLLFL